MFGVKPLRLASFRAILEDLGDAARDDPRAGQNSTADAAFGHPRASGAIRLALSAMARGSWSFVSPGPPVAPLCGSGPCHGGGGSGRGRARRKSWLANWACVRASARESCAVSAGQFAAANHPDRAPTSLRERATQRMIIAKALIDQALTALTDR